MRKRTILFVAVGLVLGAGIWLSRGALSHRALGPVVANPAPTEAAMQDFLATAPDAGAAVKQLWDSEKIPQRAFVLNYLIPHAKEDAKLWAAARPFVVSAASVADSEMQGVALELLVDHKDDRGIPTALAYLASADPEVRISGLMRLNDQRDKKWAAAFAQLLDDPDAKVRTIAASGLRNVTGQDFGMHLSATTQANAEAVGQWKKWWAEHAGEYPAAVASAMPAAVSPGAAFGFTLPTLDGKHASLGDYRGKVVLINFWATWCPSCVSEMPELGELQRSHPNDLVILGINLDGVTDGDDGEPDPDAKAIAAMRPAIENAVTEAKVSYPILLDPKGSTLGAYGAGALPTNVLVGKDGTIKRRLLGARAKEAWEALVAEAGR